MTIVNHASSHYSGKLVTGTGDGIEIDLEIVGGRTLRMSAAGDELGAWPVDECHIEADPMGDGSFRMVVDGEDARFTPSDPAEFQSLIAQVMGRPTTDAGLAPDGQNDDPEPTAVSAVEDPVAFLFGSTPPPAPIATELGDFDEPDAGEYRSEEFSEIRAPGAEVEDVETITAGAAWESPAQFESPSETDEAPAHVDAVGDEIVSAVEPVAIPVEPDAVSVEPTDEPLIEDVPPDWIDAEEDDVDEDAAREEPTGGISALDRVAAAIGSIRGSGDEPELEQNDDGEYHVGPNTVASEAIEAQRSLRQHQLKEMTKGKWLKRGGIAVATAAVIALFAFLTPGAIDFLQSYESDIAPPPEVETTAPPATAPPATEGDIDDTGATTPEALPTGEENGTIFDRPSPEFIASWDTAGGAIDEVLTFGGFPQLGSFEEQFTPYLSMNGIVQPDGTLDQFMLVIDPTGPSEYDRIGIQALGVAIAIVDPERSPQGRASLLGELGLNVRQPLLEGIDGAAEAAGIAYTLVYDAAAKLLTMTVSPAG